MKLGFARASISQKSLGQQVAALKAYGCINVIHQRYTDKPKDGFKQLLCVLDTLAKNDVLVVTKLDRLATSSSELNLIIKKLKEKHADLKVLNQKIDTTVGNRDLVFNTIIAVADCENSLVRENDSALKKPYDSEYDPLLQGEAEIYVRNVYAKTASYPSLNDVAKYLLAEFEIKRQSSSEGVLDPVSIKRRIRAKWKEWTLTKS